LEVTGGAVTLKLPEDPLIVIGVVPGVRLAGPRPFNETFSTLIPSKVTDATLTGGTTLFVSQLVTPPRQTDAMLGVTWIVA
jgi:hypothetical protein